VTRRIWKESHAKKFANAFHQNKLIKALDKDIRYGGKQIGWCRLLCAPYKEQLSAMPQNDLEAEGGMCDSIEQFIQRYFKGNSYLQVWVIRFEFIAADKQAHIPTPTRPGVYSNSAAKADSNSAITRLSLSIHKAQLPGFYLCYDLTSKNDSNCPLSSATDSIHQASLTLLGVYSIIQNRANSSFSITLSTESIHQASPALLTNFNVCSNNSHLSDSNDRASITSDSIEAVSVSAEQEHQIVPGVYLNNGSQVNANTDISLPQESIHQTSISSLGVYSNVGNQSDSNATNDSLAESIHQTPVVQGGSGLVYSFWKGESTVNHYRYKVKVNGKWKVKSIYIPVGKLPKVKEAIANKLSVTAIVAEVLGKNL